MYVYYFHKISSFLVNDKFLQTNTSWPSDMTAHVTMEQVAWKIHSI